MRRRRTKRRGFVPQLNPVTENKERRARERHDRALEALLDLIARLVVKHHLRASAEKSAAVHVQNTKSCCPTVDLPLSEPNAPANN